MLNCSLVPESAVVERRERFLEEVVLREEEVAPVVDQKDLRAGGEGGR